MNDEFRVQQGPGAQIKETLTLKNNNVTRRNHPKRMIAWDRLIYMLGRHGWIDVYDGDGALLRKIQLSQVDYFDFAISAGSILDRARMH